MGTGDRRKREKERERSGRVSLGALFVVAENSSLALGFDRPLTFFKRTVLLRKDACLATTESPASHIRIVSGRASQAGWNARQPRISSEQETYRLAEAAE